MIYKRRYNGAVDQMAKDFRPGAKAFSVVDRLHSFRKKDKVNCSEVDVPLMCVG